MSKVNTYLNFQGTTEEAFTFYAAVFGTDFHGPTTRFRDAPAGPGMPDLSDDEKEKILHIELPILGGHLIMGTDMLKSMGQEIRIGNNTTINLEFDRRDEADAYYSQLSEGGSDSTGMIETPFGYWGCSLDRFGIRWMFLVSDTSE